jgi:hypothetical protein
MTKLNPHATSSFRLGNSVRLSVFAAALVASSGTCLGQTRVTTFWDGAAGGLFEDHSRWTLGSPNNTAGIIWDAVINSTGSPYTVQFESDFGTPDIVVQTLTLDSADATLELENRNYGDFFIAESFNFPAGTLILKNAELSGTQLHTRMDIAGGARFVFRDNGSSQHINSLNNFDIYGGDLVIENSASLDITGTHIKEGALVYQTTSGGKDLITQSTIDYDIRFENTSDRRNELITNIDGLEITKDATISGMDFWLKPEGSGFPNFLPASFINNGTVRLDGGESRIEYTINNGLIDVAGGELRMYGDNQGTMTVQENASLYIYVTDNGTDVFFNNTGLIDVSGSGAKFEIDGSFFFNDPLNQDYWSSTGTLSVTDHARARIGSFKLSELGTFIRDETARIEITGQVNLDGGTMNADTFQGDVHLTYDNPGGSGGDRGEITNGIIDVAGDWLKFSEYYGYISHTEFIGGDLYVDVDFAETRFSKVIFDDISIRDGGLVLGPNGNIAFGEQNYQDGTSYFNNSLTTVTNGQQLDVRFSALNRLDLGPDAFVAGKLKLGLGGGQSALIYNEGAIHSDALTGRVDILCSIENHGLVSVRSHLMTCWWDFVNEDLVKIEFGRLEGNSFENNATLEITLASAMDLSGDLLLGENSDISIDALSFQESITVGQTMSLDGTLHLDLSRIVEPGTYQLYSAQTVIGEFDSVSVSALPEGLVFKGLNMDGSYTISLPCPADLNDDRELNFLDVSSFLSMFADGQPEADFAPDGMFNFLDVSAFLTAFAAGCP